MDKVNGIIVHQTGTPAETHVFNSYSHAGSNGAHFLIDKEGVIYQTASLFKTTWHVGQMRSRCLITKKCEPSELKKMADMENKALTKQISDLERAKPFPERYPGNIDSIGIEIVGQAYRLKGKNVAEYENINSKQNTSLKWLVSELIDTLNIPVSEIYRHPDVGRKNETEASTASW
ncbi:peptidoglycan recognition protein family protein [Morganella morganii]|uniref:peptidoglycan recognition protein family protein n=1 Tax=Morganella morganii TaxID=582 RepID=UPI00388F49AB